MSQCQDTKLKSPDALLASNELVSRDETINVYRVYRYCVLVSIKVLSLVCRLCEEALEVIKTLIFLLYSWWDNKEAKRKQWQA